MSIDSERAQARITAGFGAAGLFLFSIPYSLFPALLSGVAQFVHVFDGGFVDEGLALATDFEGVPVVPLDATLKLFTVFKHNHHRGLGVDLLLQVKEFGISVTGFAGRQSHEAEGQRRRRIPLDAPRRTAAHGGGNMCALVADSELSSLSAHKKQLSTGRKRCKLTVPVGPEAQNPEGIRLMPLDARVLMRAALTSEGSMHPWQRTPGRSLRWPKRPCQYRSSCYGWN